MRNGADYTENVSVTASVHVSHKEMIEELNNCGYAVISDQGKFPGFASAITQLAETLTTDNVEELNLLLRNVNKLPLTDGEQSRLKISQFIKQIARHSLELMDDIDKEFMLFEMDILAIEKS